MDETHVEHGVGFVEHQNFERAQIHVALSHQVQEASWRGYDESWGLAELALLRALRHASVDDHVAQAEVPAVTRHLGTNLTGELAGRSENQRAHLTARFRRPEALQYRQQKRRRLPRARLRTAEKISTRQHGRDRLRLDRSRVHVTVLQDRANQGAEQTELSERRCLDDCVGNF
jgi:hypothetical protein